MAIIHQSSHAFCRSIKMKSLILFFFVLFCSESWAKWTFYEMSDGGELFFYESNSIRKNVSNVKMWSLRSGRPYKYDEKTYLSVKFLAAYDCRNEALKDLVITFYAGEMGTGDVVVTHTYKDSETDWRPITPGAIDESAWKIACSKK